MSVAIPVLLIVALAVLLWLHGSCRLGHSNHWHYGSVTDPDGVTSRVKVCQRCVRPFAPLLAAGEMIKTPLPQNVGGAPHCAVTVVKESPARVAMFGRGSR